MIFGSFQNVVATNFFFALDNVFSSFWHYEDKIFIILGCLCNIFFFIVVLFILTFFFFQNKQLLHCTGWWEFPKLRKFARANVTRTNTHWYVSCQDKMTSKLWHKLFWKSAYVNDKCGRVSETGPCWEFDWQICNYKHVSGIDRKNFSLIFLAWDLWSPVNKCVRLLLKAFQVLVNLIRGIYPPCQFSASKYRIYSLLMTTCCCFEDPTV